MRYKLPITENQVGLYILHKTTCSRIFYLMGKPIGSIVGFVMSFVCRHIGHEIVEIHGDFEGLYCKRCLATTELKWKRRKRIDCL